MLASFFLASVKKSRRTISPSFILLSRPESHCDAHASCRWEPPHELLIPASIVRWTEYYRHRVAGNADVIRTVQRKTLLTINPIPRVAKCVVRRRDALPHRYTRFPAQSCQLGNVQQLSRRAVGLGGIERKSAAESDHVHDGLGELPAV